MLNLTDENISSNITGYFEKIISRHGGIPSKKIKKQKIEIKIILHVYCISNSRKWEYFRVFG